ncbi:MAG: DUF362 domain-containing protein, partial [Candidatus Hydrogenedentes bacterium]|nr:DUF362 domain-containing protein [Candidatus Hydrogenedentota bacterium]
MGNIEHIKEPSGNSTVVLLRCEDYDEIRVAEVVARGVALLGGVESFTKTGERILLKPNMLVAKAPDRAVTTHPSVFKAVAKLFQEAGALLSYGDSPGFGRIETVTRRTGLAAVAETMNIARADFHTGRTISFPDGHVIKQFTIAEGALDTDGIISLPKFKTHALTRFTGAVKNQFGCIPGMLKGEFHGRLNKMDNFAAMLVDLNRFLRPRLYIMDGIVAMEGNGPHNGPPRSMQSLLFSTDPVALDAVACQLVGLDPELVSTEVWGAQLGLGSFSNITILGDAVETLVCPDFDINRKKDFNADTIRPFLSRLMKNYLVPRPVIREERCIKCGNCVKMCPVTPKALYFQGEENKSVPHYDY